MNTDSGKSDGNEGARGSRGAPNEGAQGGTATSQDGDGGQRRPAAAPDVRGDDARGGGLDSNSSRSVDRDGTRSR